MILWGRLSSINVQKVAWALDELGLAFEHRNAGGSFGIVDSPDYRALNPNGLVPTLDDDGFVLWESNAIVRYLAAKHPEHGLFPADLRIRADADRWMDWQTTAATPALRDAFWNLIRTAPERRDEAATQRSLARSEAMAKLLDRHLADRLYVAGETFTMGDIAVGAHVQRWLAMPIERPRLAALEAWHTRLAARPGAARVFAVALT